VLGLVQRRSDDLGDAVRARRLNQLSMAASEQVLADPVLPAFGLGHVRGEPAGQLVRVGDTALAKHPNQHTTA